MATEFFTDIDLNGRKVIDSGAPSAATDLVTKAYADAIASGIMYKEAVRVVATTNGTLATAYENGDTVDGVTLASFDRILLAGQTTTSENGIYLVASSGPPVRAPDADAAGELKGGTTVWVNEGTTYGDTAFSILTPSGSVTPGSTNHTWGQTSGLGQITAGGGIGKTGNTLSVAAGTDLVQDADGISLSSNVPRLNTGNIFSGPVEIDTAVGEIPLILDVHDETSNVLRFLESNVLRGSFTIDSNRLVLAAVDSLVLDGTSIDASANNIINLATPTTSGHAANKDYVDALTGSYSEAIGDGVATSITTNHNLGTRDVIVEVYRASGAYDRVYPDIEHSTTNNVITRWPAGAPSSGQYRVVVKK